MNAGTLKVISVYILICLIWGSTWLAIRFGLESLTPFISSGLRFLLASFLIALIMKIRGISLQKDRTSVILYLQLGFFTFTIPFALIYWSEQFVPSGLAAVLFAVYPFFILLFTYFAVPDEKIDIFKLGGMIIGFAGIIVIFSDQFGGDLSSYFIGMAAIVLSGIMQAGNAVIIKKYGYHLNPLSMNLIPMFISGLLLLVGGIIFENISGLKFDLNAVLSVTFLAIFGSIITFTSFYWLLKQVSIILLSLVAFITPVIALILGWLLYNEVLMTHHLTGSGMVLAGLLTANLSNVFNQKNKRQEQAVLHK